MTDYANGRAPESALDHVDGVHVVPAIAPRVTAFIDWAAANGHEIHIAKPYGGYRNLHEQQIVYEQGATGGSHVRVAKPGSSTHGIYAIGRVDLVGASGFSYTKAELAWIVANAGKFGLYREFGADDPNHFEQTGTFTASTSESNLNNETVSEEDESMTPRTVTIDGGKTFIIQFPDGRSKPLIDYRTGQPMDSATVQALNLYLRYDAHYYPYGVPGAAVLSPQAFYQFSQALDPTGSQFTQKPAS